MGLVGLDGAALTLTLSQRERGLTPFSLWEKGRG